MHQGPNEGLSPQALALALVDDDDRRRLEQAEQPLPARRFGRHAERIDKHEDARARAEVLAVVLREREPDLDRRAPDMTEEAAR